MKNIRHHIKKFLSLMVKAENVSTREEAQKIIKKAEKHQRKISILRGLTKNDN